MRRGMGLAALVMTVAVVGGMATCAARASGRDEKTRRLDPDALGLPEDWLAEAEPIRKLSTTADEAVGHVRRGPTEEPVRCPLEVTDTVVMEIAVVEPTIRQVQQAAIRYAEVMPEKIQNWRTRAAWRAWVPHVTLSVDHDTNTTIGSSSSGGKTAFTVGPDDRSVSLGYGFTWDLGDLVWNPDQTSIDTRSRLMVQLRNDVLDEVTRLYFERRRLQVEARFIPVKEPSLRAERQLRIEELTAQLDALTGGWFSTHHS